MSTASPPPWKLALFDATDRPAAPRAARDWLCFAQSLRPAAPADWPNWLCFARIGALPPLTSNIKLPTSPTHVRPPITRRVAGIYPEKWIAPPSNIAVSPCTDANKENLGGGPFWVLDCCTNRRITGALRGRRSRRIPTNPSLKSRKDAEFAPVHPYRPMVVGRRSCARAAVDKA